MALESPVIIHSENSNVRVPKALLREHALRIYAGEQLSPQRYTNIICCSDYSIRRLNREYRTIDRVTDVLSFPFDDEDFLGEIYISIRRTAVQARKLGHSFTDEFLRLFVHGMLHLAGYDHLKPAEQTQMNQRENHYLQKNLY
jgi:probable rRNA maturation factor